MLALLAVRGSPFDAGATLGRFGAAAVHRHLLPSAAWAGLMRWRGSPRVEAMAELVRTRFPRIQAELEGLAAGLALPFDDVFLWNCRGDLWAMAADGCTTLQLPGTESRRLVHNEDGHPAFAGHCAIAEFGIDGGPDFASFVYPGSLPGHSFAVTDAGLAMTVNGLRTLHVDAGVPRMVLARALLDAASLDEAVATLREAPRAGGFHLSLAHREAGDILSIEFNSYACSVRAVAAPALHANHAIHPGMRDLPQLITGSSGHRQRRGNSLLAQAGERQLAVDALAILWDRQHARFPIYRDDPADDDNENTIATADIVVRRDRIDWQVYEAADQPARIRLRDGHCLAPA
jgi:hypothetical protein